MKQRSHGAWGGVCCGSDPGCSAGSSNKRFARRVAFSTGGIAVSRGCPGGSVRPGAQWGSQTSDADGCFILGKAAGGFPPYALKACPAAVPHHPELDDSSVFSLSLPLPQEALAK